LSVAHAGISRRAFGLGAAGAGAAAALSSCAGPIPKAVDAWSAFLDDIARQLAADAPERAHLSGAAFRPPRANALLADRSLTGEDIRRTAAIRRAAQMQGFDLGEIPLAKRADRQAVATVLAGIADLAALPFGRLEADGRYRPYALDPVGAAAFALPIVFATAPGFSSLADGQAWLERLKRVPDAIGADTEKLVQNARAGMTPPLFLLDRVSLAFDALASAPLEYSPYRQAFVQRATAFAGALDAANATADAVRLRALLGQADAVIRARITPAHQAAAAAARQLRPRAPANPSYARGPDAQVAWRRVVAQQLGPAFDYPAARARLETEIAAHAQALSAALVGLGAPSAPDPQAIGAQIAYVRGLPRPPAADLEAQRAAVLGEMAGVIVAASEAFSAKFGPGPAAKIGVQRGADWQMILGGAPLLAPGDGTAAARVWMPLPDPARLPRLDAVMWALREGAPGLGLAQAFAPSAQDAAQSILRLAPSLISQEGWGVYAFYIAEDIGLFDADPTVRAAGLYGRLLSAAAARFELDLNAAGMGFEDCLAAYTATLGVARQEGERVAAAFLSAPGAGLAGDLGCAAILALRRRAQATLGAQFDLKSFHTVILAALPGPLSALDSAVQAWTARR
jgi:uncharacterized protein (DUF885 family)